MDFNASSTQIAILVIVVLCVALAGAIALIFVQRRRSERLRQRFGSEYDRTVTEEGSRRRAEAELQAREERVRRLDIRPLTPEDRDRYDHAWQSAQKMFVDSPAAALVEAERLVCEVMRARGYPVADFDHRVADISVDHPAVVENYRAAREISKRGERQILSTEDARRGMVHYRALFEDLLEVGAPEPVATR